MFCLVLPMAETSLTARMGDGKNKSRHKKEKKNKTEKNELEISMPLVDMAGIAQAIQIVRWLFDIWQAKKKRKKMKKKPA